MKIRLALPFCLALMVALMARDARAAIVYQSGSFSGTSMPVSGSGLSSLGDSILLAGTDRHVTQVDIDSEMLAGGGATAYTGNFTLTLYANDGPLVTSIPMPGTVLGSSTTSATLTPGEAKTLSFPFSFLSVPTALHFQLSEGTPSQNFRLKLANLGTVGSSSPGFVVQRVVGSPNFQPNNVGFGNQIAATVFAVPEPNGAGLLALGVLSLTARRRRRLQPLFT